MRRSLSLPISLCSLLLLLAGRADAATPLTGSTSCDLQGRLEFLPTLPTAAAATSTPVRAKAKVQTNVCDGSGVSGGRAPLTSARVTFNAVLAAGTECSSFLDEVTLVKSKLTVKWGGFREGRVVAIGTSKAAVASAAYDQGSGAFVIVTQPIVKGSFAGSTMTMRLDLGDVSEFSEYCDGPDNAGFAAFVFGPPLNDNSWTISVP